MRKLLALSIVVAALGGGVATNTAQANTGHHKVHVHLFVHKITWIEKWEKADESIYPAIRIASHVFHVDKGLLENIVGGEGGNINPRTLQSSLCSGSQPGWNNFGSYAFGPFQFMLDRKPACMVQTEWGTFGSYDDAAFQEAKKLGVSVPYRFKSPASNVGQAITAAYMIAHGKLSAWCASQC